MQICLVRHGIDDFDRMDASAGLRQSNNAATFIQEYRNLTVAPRDIPIYHSPKPRTYATAQAIGAYIRIPAGNANVQLWLDEHHRAENVPVMQAEIGAMEKSGVQTIILVTHDPIIYYLTKFIFGIEMGLERGGVIIWNGPRGRMHTYHATPHQR